MFHLMSSNWEFLGLSREKKQGLLSLHPPLTLQAGFLMLLWFGFFLLGIRRPMHISVNSSTKPPVLGEQAGLKDCTYVGHFETPPTANQGIKLYMCLWLDITLTTAVMTVPYSQIHPIDFLYKIRHFIVSTTMALKESASMTSFFYNFSIYH